MSEENDTPGVHFASADMVSLFEKEVQIVLGRLATFFGKPGIARAWVSDRSYPSDFDKVDDYAELSEAVGVDVKKGDAIWEVAAALRNKSGQSS